MRKVSGLLVLGILLTPSAAVPPAGAQNCHPNLALSPCAQLQFHGGPVLQSFTIYPLYFGEWAQSDIATQQTFLNNFAAYLSGVHAPAGQQPTVWQYGPRQATVADPVMANTNSSPDSYQSTCSPNSSPGTLALCDIPIIIANNQGPGPNQLPPWGPQVLIIVFPTAGYTIGCGGSCLGYHSSLSNSQFFAVVSPTYYPTGPYLDAASQFQAATSHEIFEGATDPSDNNFNAWVSAACLSYTMNNTYCNSPTGLTWLSSQEEAADQCDTVVTLDWPTAPNSTLQFTRIADNTKNGECTASGYMTLDEFTAYDKSETEIKSLNDTELMANNYQLYILQSYTTSDGHVHYNAVWRPQSPGTTPGGGAAPGPYQATQSVDFSHDAPYQVRFANLYASGARLYYLQAYTLPDGKLLYNAVWRQSTAVLDTFEEGVFGLSYEDFRHIYKATFPTVDWRLQMLQTSVPSNGSLLYDAVWRDPDGVNANQPSTPCTCLAEQHVYG